MLVKKITLEEFYTDLLKLVPYKEEQDKPFKKRLERCLSEYESLISQLRINGVDVDPDTKKEISAICKQIKNAVRSSLGGAPSTAFRQIGNLFVEIKKRSPKIDLRELVKSINVGDSFYRVRKMDLPCGVRRKELFHIPIPSRGMVKSYRYSSPGYPCLYLSGSIYGCWEEMRRPPMFQCAVARFKNEETLNIIDLTIPVKADMAKDFYQKLMPLIMACMIKVSDDNAIYKPEYIVPQLLIEWILRTRSSRDYKGVKPIHGVKYHSTQLNKEFEFPIEKMENYALPVFSVDPQKRYCPKLCEAFSLTQPTNNENEKLKEGYDKDPGVYDGDPDEQKEHNYLYSDFGRLEERLKRSDKFPLKKINYKDGTDKT